MKAAVLRKADPELKEKRCDASPSDSGGSSAAVGLPLFLRRTAPGPGHARALGQASRVPVRSALPAFLATAPIQAFGAPSLNVSSPQDAAEKEATDTAKKIMRLAIPEFSASPLRSHRGGVLRQVTQSAAPAVPKVASNFAANMRNDVTLGSPLPPALRGFMEPRFSADFRNVRIHTGEPAAKLNRRLRARAFATGNHIFFGKDRFQPESDEGKELIAHELTHTIQQGTVVQRSADMSITQQPSAQVQRQEEGGGEDQGTVLNYFAREAILIPGFRMFTIVLGVNPITMSKVQRNAANILRALIELLPMGGLITQALDNSGVFDKAGAFVERQLAMLAITGDAIKQAVKDFMAGLGLLDLAHPGNLWERAKRIFTDPIDRIISFAEGLVNDIVQMVKDAILRPIAKLAEGTAGYDLLKAVLGKDPITEEPVEPTPENLIGPFMKLIGEEGVWETMKEAKAVPRAWAWFQKAVGDLIGFVREIPTLFVNALKSLQLEDIILVPTAFAKLANVFGGFLVRFTNWGMSAVWNLLEIIFDVVSPGALGYIKKTGSALKNILKNPLPFVGHLVKAAKLGFQNFAHNFLAHLKAGLIDWLTGSLPGIYIPKAFSLGEIVKFAFSVLGLTWANVRQKLVKVVGEPAVKAMETGFDIVVTLVTQGPAAAWDKIKEQLANLQDMVIGGITDFVVDMVVQKAVPKLIAMFIPGAGFISAIVSIYDTVMVFVNKLSQIAQVVSGFIDSIVAIAGGVIGAAAARVETTLAGLLSLAINFLAGFAGLGKVADKVMGVINKVRAPIDKALDWLINWIVTMAKKAGRFIAQAGVPQDPEARLKSGMQAAVAAVNRFGGRRVGAGVLNPLLSAIKVRYGFQILRVLPTGRNWSVEGIVNPRLIEPTQATQELATATEQATIQGPQRPPEALIRILSGHPFNYNYNSPQGRQAIDAIIANINAAGDVGFRYVEILASGILNGAQGFADLVSQIRNPQMTMTAYPVVQEALRMIEAGIRVNSLRFEDREAGGDYDIDLGILNRRGGYSMVNQVKRTTQTGVIGNINGAIGQLRNVNATRKVVVIYVSGITYNNYSLTLDREVSGRVAGTRIQVDIVLVDDGGRRIRYNR